jgi:hypothetical protein
VIEIRRPHFDSSATNRQLGIFVDSRKPVFQIYLRRGWRMGGLRLIQGPVA